MAVKTKAPAKKRASNPPVAAAPRESIAELRARLRRTEMLIKLSQRVAVIDSLLEGKNLSTVAVTPSVVTAVCTATLAAAPVTMF